MPHSLKPSSDGPVLGLNFGTHDSAAAIVADGRVIAAAEEERFNREKHTKAYPEQAICYCLREAGINPAELAAVAFFVDPKLQALLPLITLYHAFPRSLGTFWSDVNKYWLRRSSISQIRGSGVFSPNCPVTPVRHHLAHAASSYMMSPFDEAVVITIDGRGEYETACIFEGHDGRLALRHHVLYPHSIGYLYSMVTRHLGFRPQRDEFKVTGLAAYGTPSLVGELSRLARFDCNSFKLSLKYFDHVSRPSSERTLFSKQFLELVGPPRLPGEPITDRHCDIAYALQHVTEILIDRYLSLGQQLVPSRYLCFSGGVALNCAANASIISSGRFDRIFIQPAANDAGTSVGAALITAQRRSGNSARPRCLLDSLYLGPCYDTVAINNALRELPSTGYTVRHYDSVYEHAAHLIARGRIIGWFHGRMEFGPRALGGRSILAASTDRSIRTRINALIKDRETFRPLAPAVLAEEAEEYFELHEAGRMVYPFMLTTARVIANKQARIPAAVHEDGTARVQLVVRSSNPHLWSLIVCYRQETGIPLVLNTSFNHADEPIVCSPSDAIRTFVRCGLDALVIGQTVIERAGDHTIC